MRDYTFVRKDLLAGLVVFLVALPLCLGVATACGVPPLAGLVAGVVGGLIVPLFSRSPVSVSGPAAGLVLIVIAGLAELGYAGFLLALLLSGLLQIGLGLLGAGRVVKLVPVPVIKGMLASIGLTLIIRQLPLAVGLSSAVIEGEVDTLTPSPGLLLHSPFGLLLPGAVWVSVAALLVLAFWSSSRLPTRLQRVPGPLVAVLCSMILSALLGHFLPSMALPEAFRVQVPTVDSLAHLVRLLPDPDLARLADPAVWRVAVVLAVVASLETLLSIEAVEQLAPQHRGASPNRELIAQGVGNALSAWLGGLPVTSVIVRSSANVHAGARTRLATMTHGVLLLASVFLLPGLLQEVPLASLAAILLYTGWKLAHPTLFLHMLRRGHAQALPFIATLIGALATDLLLGILIGLATSLLLMLRAHLRRAVSLTSYRDSYLLVLRKDVSFLVRPLLTRCLERVPDGASLIIDAERADFIDQDILETLEAFVAEAKTRNLTVDLRHWPSAWGDALSAPGAAA